MKPQTACVTIALFFFVFAAKALAEKDTAQVTLPLTQYTSLVHDASNPKDPAAPSGFALSNATVTVHTRNVEEAISASVEVRLLVSVLENKWVNIPILPPGTAVKSASVSGKAIELIPTPKGLSWGTKTKGPYTVDLSYSVDAQKSDHGYSLAIPLPEAAAITISADLPGTGIDASIIPAVGPQTTQNGNFTNIQATIPTSSGVLLSWRIPTKTKQIISRANYEGRLSKDAVTWKATYLVELFGDESYPMPIVPQNVTLQDIEVDDKPAPILVENGKFAALIKGIGKHTVVAKFQIPVEHGNGPPHIDIPTPRVPVSEFTFHLPGKKEIQVSPLTNVTYGNDEKESTAFMHVPMTENVHLSWSEALPEDIKEQFRANATLYHAAYAEEGVMLISALVQYEVTRGKTNSLELEIPKNIQINKVTSPSGGVSDWRITLRKDESTDLLTVFLDREVRKNIDVNISYDKSINPEAGAEELTLPLLQAAGVHRQRGMAALLSSKELTLSPVTEEKVTKVGENQLPAFFHQTLDKVVAHTYKYAALFPTIVVRTEKPERKQGKFNATVNTLVSLTDVTMKASASIDINVKSGAISSLELVLPEDINLLGLTAPSLRTHKTRTEAGNQIVTVEFTQDIEGQFRVELNYERIIADELSESKVPTVRVHGAEVEHGKIAIEALSAVEVGAASVTQLSTVDPSELPQQLILKTTNPILLAYKYVHVDPPYELKLRITRHDEINIQTASIDRAHYRTLFTKDGIAVTAASFWVRNSREQFLRMSLPSGSKVWSATVNGKVEKPALASGAKDAKDGNRKGPQILVKILNSSQGFPVTVTYQTPSNSLGFLGRLEGTLARPDMVVTDSRWDVYLPEHFSYGTPSSNMDITQDAHLMNEQMIRQEMQGDYVSKESSPLPPVLNVPLSGIKLSFKKLYANQTADDAYFVVPYVSSSGAMGAQGLALVALLALSIGIWMFQVLRKKVAGLALIIGGTSGLSVLIGRYGISFWLPLFVAGVFVIAWAIRRYSKIRAEVGG